MLYTMFLLIALWVINDILDVIYNTALDLMEIFKKKF